jgi:DNA-binding transcriptional MerR regulator
MTNADSLLTVSDVAKRFEVAPDTVRMWNRQGKLAASRTVSGMRLFSEGDVYRFEVERQGRKAPQST